MKQLQVKEGELWIKRSELGLDIKRIKRMWRSQRKIVKKYRDEKIMCFYDPDKDEWRDKNFKIIKI